MPIMKTLNGYEVVDAKARQDIENIEVPTKVSDLENDKGYLTEHQDLSAYATKTFVNNAVQAAIDDIPEPDVDLSNYYTKEETDKAIREASFVSKDDFDAWELDFVGALEKEYYDKAGTDKAISDAIQTALSGIATAEGGSY